jgi:hypothetical protein
MTGDVITEYVDPEQNPAKAVKIAAALAFLVGCFLAMLRLMKFGSANTTDLLDSIPAPFCFDTAVCQIVPYHLLWDVVRFIGVVVCCGMLWYVVVW